MANGGVQYTLQFVNNSSNAGSACVYQTPPNIAVGNIMSLAWFAEYAYPTTTINFDWEIDYSFVWSETGVLVPGVVFQASQTWAADLSTLNQIGLTYSQAFTFQNQGPGPSQGSLYIFEDSTIPAGIGSVGIGMSGAGTFAVQAQPNLTLKMTPHPEYWITFGNFTQGQVIDQTEITGAALVQFPDNVYDMLAILNADNSWTIQQNQS